MLAPEEDTCSSWSADQVELERESCTWSSGEESWPSCEWSSPPNSPDPDIVYQTIETDSFRTPTKKSTYVNTKGA